MHEKTKDLKKAIKNAEAEVARLDAERAELMKQLAAPAENTNFASIGRRLTQVQHEIDILLRQ